MPLSPRRLAAVAAAVALSGVALAGCSNASDSPDPSSMPGMNAPTASGSTATSTTSIAFADATQGSIHLAQGYVFATAGMDMGSASPSASASAPAAMSAAYATLRNAGSSDDALVSVTTAAAGMVQLHETVDNGGNAGSMHEVQQVAIPAGGSAELKPGGTHVMLMQLTGPLRAGTTIAMTWTFKSGTVITTTFPVIERSQRPG